MDLCGVVLTGSQTVGAGKACMLWTPLYNSLDSSVIHGHRCQWIAIDTCGNTREKRNTLPFDFMENLEVIAFEWTFIDIVWTGRYISPCSSISVQALKSTKCSMQGLSPRPLDNSSCYSSVPLRVSSSSDQKCFYI